MSCSFIRQKCFKVQCLSLYSVENFLNVIRQHESLHACWWQATAQLLFLVLYIRGVSPFNTYGHNFWGMFVKLWKVTYCHRVCLSILMEQLDSHWTDFREMWYLIIFRKSLKKIQGSLKSNDNGYFTWRSIYIFDHILISSS